MPCTNRFVVEPNQEFRFRVTNAQNLLTVTGTLSDVQANANSQTESYTEAELRAGESWDLVSGNTCVLILTAIPQDATQDVSVTTEFSIGPGAPETVTCRRRRTGVVSTWDLVVR